MIDRLDLEHILNHTRDLWEELRGAHLFITGGTGFFGCWLLESFIYVNQKLDLKAHASVLTRRPAAVKQSLPHLMLNPAVALLEGDVRNFEFPKAEYSHVIHAATEASVTLNTGNPLLMLDTIVEGTRHTLEFARFCGAKNFLLTSSGAVYGKQPSEMNHIPEEYVGGPDPLDPKSAYAEGKRLAEFLCSLYADSNLEPKIARGFTFVGPYFPLDIHFAIGNFIRDVMNQSAIIIKGDGTPHRSYLYAADLAIWLWTILIRGESMRSYNVGSDESLSIAEIAARVTTCASSPAEIKILRKATPGQPIERYVPSIARARNELGLDVRISFNEGIKRTLDFFEKAK